MDFSKSLMPEKSLQVTRLRLVTWKDFSGICDLEKSILALPPHRIGSFLWRERKLSMTTRGRKIPYLIAFLGEKITNRGGMVIPPRLMITSRGGMVIPPRLVIYT